MAGLFSSRTPLRIGSPAHGPGLAQSAAHFPRPRSQPSPPKCPRRERSTSGVRSCVATFAVAARSRGESRPSLVGLARARPGRGSRDSWPARTTDRGMGGPVQASYFGSCDLGRGKCDSTLRESRARGRDLRESPPRGQDYDISQPRYSRASVVSSMNALASSRLPKMYGPGRTGSIFVVPTG